MHSPGPSPTESPINLLKTNASRDEMRFRDLPPSPVINIPPCACAIQQMTKNVSPSASKDDIPWMKDEGLCPGKKYRPYESGAYSCKTYPGNKFCRRNPFIKEVIRMRKKKLEEKELKNTKSSAGVLSDIPASPPKELLSTDQYNSEKKIEQTTAVAVSLRRQLCKCSYKKKIPMYNVSGIVSKKSDERTVDETKLEEVDRIIGGVVYFTPPVSLQRSDELIESPYNICIGKRTGKVLKKKRKSCGCNNGRDADQKKDIEETRRKLMEGKSPEERWKIALEDAALKEYFTQRKYVPCWTSCKKFRGGPKSLRNSRNPRLVSDVRDNSHRHWSPTNPSALSRKDALKEEMKQKEKVGNKMFKLSHEDRNEQDATSSMQLTYQEAYNEKEQLMRIEKNQETEKSHTNVKEKMFKFKRSNKTINKRKYQKKDKIIDETKQYSKENTDEIKHRQNTSHKQMIDKAREEMNNKISHRINDDSDKKYADNDLDLMAILKVLPINYFLI